MAGRKQDSCGVRNEEEESRMLCNSMIPSKVLHTIFKLLLSVALFKSFVRYLFSLGADLIQHFFFFFFLRFLQSSVLHT